MRSGFNPSVGILGGHTVPLQPVPRSRTCVSIPQSGFLVVTHYNVVVEDEGVIKFQSLSRDSWWSHKGIPSEVQGQYWFQSLSRDSWWSHL
jgi:hypothetical protein